MLPALVTRDSTDESAPATGRAAALAEDDSVFIATALIAADVPRALERDTVAGIPGAVTAASTDSFWREGLGRVFEAREEGATCGFIACSRAEDVKGLDPLAASTAFGSEPTEAETRSTSPGIGARAALAAEDSEVGESPGGRLGRFDPAGTLACSICRASPVGQVEFAVVAGVTTMGTESPAVSDA